MRKSITIKFSEQEKFPEISELSLFLREFKSVYSLVFRTNECFSCFPKDDSSISEENVKQIRLKIKHYLETHHSDVGSSLPNRFFKIKESSENELLVEKISKESPVKIIVGGLAFVIVVAVILSGGKFSLRTGPLSLNLEIGQPLSQSIKDMRGLFKNPENQKRRE
ncbi:hypothetical protein [Candidatus Mycalebacterium sp.]